MTTTEAAEPLVPFDPYELQDTVAGDMLDPFTRMAELLAESPVHVGPVDLGMGVGGELRTRRAGDRPRLRRVRAGAAGQRDLLVHGLRGRGGRGDGADHPADGRARAPDAAGPGLAGLPLEDARALGGEPGADRGRRADRPVRRQGPRRPREGAHLQLPRPGDRPHPRASPQRLPEVPAVGDRDHQRHGHMGPRRGRLRGAAGLLRRRAGRAAPEPERRPHHRARAGRGGRPAPQRRGDLLVPPPAAAGRRGDHLPRLGQPALRAC